MNIENIAASGRVFVLVEDNKLVINRDVYGTVIRKCPGMLTINFDANALADLRGASRRTIHRFISAIGLELGGYIYHCGTWPNVTLLNFSNMRPSHMRYTYSQTSGWDVYYGDDVKLTNFRFDSTSGDIHIDAHVPCQLVNVFVEDNMLFHVLLQQDRQVHAVTSYIVKNANYDTDKLFDIEHRQLQLLGRTKDDVVAYRLPYNLYGNLPCDGDVGLIRINNHVRPAVHVNGVFYTRDPLPDTLDLLINDSLTAFKNTAELSEHAITALIHELNLASFCNSTIDKLIGNGDVTRMYITTSDENHIATLLIGKDGMVTEFAGVGVYLPFKADINDFIVAQFGY